MLKVVITLLLFTQGSVYALVPLEGLIYGDVKDIKQFDPLSGVFSDSAIVDKSLENDLERTKLEDYMGLYKQGAKLQFTCQMNEGSSIRYLNSWKESVAKRSVVSTLQYIGIDHSMRAIVEYMKTLEYSKKEFDNVVKNLVNNTCSKNLSIYSMKLIKNNFYNMYETSTGFKIPSIEKSPYFTKAIRQRTNSRQAKQNEFNFALKNFRAFCSWGGDTDDYRMLVPYLKNPFIMSHVYDHILNRKMHWNNVGKFLTYKKRKNAIKIVCEDLICRKTTNVIFQQKFPKMIGSTDIEVDLDNLYCKHFKNVDYRYKDQIPQIKKWQKAQSMEEPILEAMNFVSLITGIPDLLISSQKYTDLLTSLKENIDSRWTKWAVEKNEQFVVDLLYEESLNIDLVPMAQSEEVLKGNFQMKFDFTLGELDRVLNVVDKVTAKFHLEFPKSYLRWIRNDYIKKTNLSDHMAVKYIEDKVRTYVNIQLATKSDLFLIPLWNNKMGDIITHELIEQITRYKGSLFSDFSHTKIKVPIKMRFGLFALKYLNEKFKAKYRSKSLTFNK